jgi:hypothetical protein
MNSIKTLLPAMTIEEVKASCPQAFAQHPSNTVSNKYVFVNTETIITDMEALGWYVVTAKQRKSQKNVNTRFTPHMIIFQNPDVQITSEDEKLAVSVILLNSHDGTQVLQFRMGIFRAACSNGLVIPVEEYSSFKMRHRGYSFESLRESMLNFLSSVTNKIDVINKMVEIDLTEDQKMDMALKALLIRNNISFDAVDAPKYSEATLKSVLAPRRPQDRFDSLWLVMNRVQEAITHGGFKIEIEVEKPRKLPAVKSFEKDFDLNEKLFSMALEYVN